MKIIFSPFFTANTFALNSHQTNLFGVAVAGEYELLATLELFLGIHTPKVEKLSREIMYYKACKAVIQSDKESIFRHSFETDELGTSNNLLKWRDALSFCGWNKNMTFKSERLTLLSQIDHKFQSSGNGDRWQIVISYLHDTNITGHLSEISVELPKDVLPPHLTLVLDLLEKQHIQITYKEYTPENSASVVNSNLDRIRHAFLSDNSSQIELDPNDKSSIRILEFETSNQASEWVATQPIDQWDVCINRDNKAFDDIQYLLGIPSSGSQTNNSHTQIIQLFKLAAGLFESPLNINNLLGWLNTNVNPIPAYVRFSLARVVASEGGLGNQKWLDQIQKLTQLTDEEKELTEDEQKEILKRKEYNKTCIDTFIPKISDQNIRAAVLDFFGRLKHWSFKRINTPKETSSFEKEIETAQFIELTAMIDALLELINNEKTISFDKLFMWATKIYKPIAMPYTEASKGSRFIVNSPADIATSADSCLWMDFYDYQNPDVDTSFLRTDEKDELLKQDCYFWEQEKQNRYNYFGQIHPFICTQKALTLISVKKNGLNDASKHPLFLRLKATMEESMFALLLHKVCLDGHAIIQVPKEETLPHPLYCQFKNKEGILMPKTTSYTALSQLIQNPADFVFERILKFNEASISVLNSLDTTKGNVAHALIEYYLLKCKNEETADLSTFDEIFLDVVQKQGALLLQRENMIQQMQFKHELKSALETLLNILESNGLSVVDCEQKFEGQLYNDPDSPVMIGYIDLKVRDTRNNHFIIDMKWTQFKSNQRRLKQNKALQLSIYKHFTLQNNEEIMGTGYYVMPANRLYTTCTNLSGKNITVVNPENDDELMPKCINSYLYRVSEIKNSGKIEIAEGMNLTEINYFNESDYNNLYPLEHEYNDENIKKINAYSAYKLFKNELL